MIKVLHSILQFIWHNLIGITIWIWIIWVTMNILEARKKLDIIEENNGLIIDWIEIHKKAIEDIKPIQPSDTIPPIPPIPHSEIRMDRI